jgi:hypothetical protein
LKTEKNNICRETEDGQSKQEAKAIVSNMIVSNISKVKDILQCVFHQDTSKENSDQLTLLHLSMDFSMSINASTEEKDSSMVVKRVRKNLNEYLRSVNTGMQSPTSAIENCTKA